MSIIGQIGLFVAKKIVQKVGIKTVAKTAVKQAVKHPSTALKIAGMVINAVKK